MKGVHQEVRARFHKSVENYIIVSRVLQGQDDFRSASAQEKEDIALRFRSMKETLSSINTSRAKAKQKASAEEEEEEYTGPIPDEEPKTGFFQTRHLSLEERKKLHALKKAWKKKNENRTTAGTSAGSVSSTNLGTTSSNLSVAPSSSSPYYSSTPSILEPENEDMERAIRESVAQTSTGDREEDARIEAQIRASVQEMRRVAEANRRQQDQLRDWKHSPSAMATPSSASSMTAVAAPTDWRSSAKGQEASGMIPNDISDEEYEALIAEAVRQSMTVQAHTYQQQQQQYQHLEGHSEEGEEDHPGIVMTDNTTTISDDHDKLYEMSGNKEDDELMRAMRASMQQGAPSSQQQQQQQQGVTAGNDNNDDEEDEELKRAMEESARAHREHLARASSERTEEEIIMEYVKKQSLAEEEFRRQKAKGKQTAREGEGEEDDDEDLRRALEESLKMSGKDGGPSSSAG